MTDRYYSMWQSLVERVEAAQRAPVTEEGVRVLQWVRDEMDAVWNEYRHLKYVDDSKPGDINEGQGTNF